MLASSSRPEAFICDVDGTVALKGDRNPFDYASVDRDRPNTPIVQLVRMLITNGIQAVFVSGREELARAKTEEWLISHIGVSGPLMMRANGDYRPDSEIKHEMYINQILGKFDVGLVLDDRDQVVEMWRTRAGLTCLQVAQGDF